jgi:hypothetical protein
MTGRDKRPCQNYLISASYPTLGRSSLICSLSRSPSPQEHSFDRLWTTARRTLPNAQLSGSADIGPVSRWIPLQDLEFAARRPANSCGERCWWRCNGRGGDCQGGARIDGPLEQGVVSKIRLGQQPPLSGCFNRRERIATISFRPLMNSDRFLQRESIAYARATLQDHEYSKHLRRAALFASHCRA